MVAELLCDQFPRKALVFHSYLCLRTERDLRCSMNQEVLLEGEADFVVVHPRLGILKVELKGGKMFYTSESCRWNRIGAANQGKDPFEQASRNMRMLEDLVLSVEEWKKGVGILVTSLYQFNGLAEDALILVDVDEPDPEAPPYGFKSEHDYVGCWRAKHLLTVVSQTELGL